MNRSLFIRVFFMTALPVLVLPVILLRSAQVAQAQTSPFLLAPYYGMHAITQSYSSGHPAYDFDLSHEQVLAADVGTIDRVRWYNNSPECHGPVNNSACGYGLHIYIHHGNGYTTRYGHLSATAFDLDSVTIGTTVQRGQIIGTSGNTGWAYGGNNGLHLHFEVTDANGNSVDPFAPNLWNDGQWAGRPIPAPINGGETVVDDATDNTGGFSKGENNGVMPPPFNNACTGDCANWTTYAAGNDGDMYSTLVNGSTPDSWARWQALVPASGSMYEVFVYIPSVNKTTWQAPYTVRYFNNSTQTTARVDQYGLSNQWVSIGTYYMTSNDYVFTTDATGESQGVHCGAGQYCRLGVDAVKFVRRSATYMPYVNTSDNWVSTVEVRNNGGGPALARLVVSDRSGYVWCTSFTNTPLPVRGVQTWVISPSACPQAAEATVDSSQDIAVVVREEQSSLELNEYNGILASGGSDGWERAGSTVYVPLIKNNRYGRSSKIYIMNAGDQTTAAEVHLYDVIDGHAVITLTYSLDINRSVRVRADDCTTSTSRCSVKITSPTGQPLAVTVLEQDDATTLYRITYSGYSSGATQNFAPIVKRNRYGKTTGLAIENVGTAATNITVTCYDMSGGSSQCGSQTNLAPNATAVFGQLSVNDKYVGSARVTSSGQPIVTAIYESGSPTQKVADAPLSGTPFAYVPELYGNYSMGGQTWDSGISIQNASTSNANVTVTYYDQLGNQVGLPQTVTGLLLYRVWILNRAGGNLPNGFAGSAVITANQPVVAIANHSHTGNGDTEASYTVPNR